MFIFTEKNNIFHISSQKKELQQKILQQYSALSFFTFAKKTFNLFNKIHEDYAI